MSRSLMLMILGGIVLLSPFLGLPLAILTWILPVLGIAILAIGFSYRDRGQKAPEDQHEASLPAST
ncbi:MAG TPA: hypothetical protein VNU25_03925 [Candidatus Paceibacterota bacterium]|nr:hypothetical protein [Candidatus Paceibacterota bacterium]